MINPTRSQGALKVPAIGLGIMGLTSFYKSKDELSQEERSKFLDDAIKLGVRFFDTAQLYNTKSGNNEKLLGDAIKHYPREDFIISTKHSEDNEIDQIRSSIKDSLEFLQTSYIDIYFLHRVYPWNIIEAWTEMKKLVEEGLVRHIGLSEASPEYIRICHQIHPVASVQIEYSLGCREIEEDVIPCCNELGIGIMAYSPLARGLFASNKKFEDFEDKSFFPYTSKENWDFNNAIVRKCEDLASKLSCTTSQLALAWVLSRGENVCIIPGTTKLSNLESNMKSAEVLQKLTNEDLDLLSKLGTFKGERYPSVEYTYKGLMIKEE